MRLNEAMNKLFVSDGFRRFVNRQKAPKYVLDRCWYRQASFNVPEHRDIDMLDNLGIFC